MSSAESTWSNPKLTKLSFAVGAESFLAERALKIFRQQLQVKFPELETASIHEGEYSEGRILDLAAPSLFGEPRLLTIQNPGEAAISELREFLGSEASDVYVWVRVQGAPALQTKIRKEFGGEAQFITCDELKNDSAKLAFAKAEVEATGKTVTPDGLRALVSAFSTDLAELASACAQLATSPQAKFDRNSIDSLFGGRVETTVFKIADAAFAGNAAEAVRLLRHSFNTGLDPVQVVGSLAGRVRQLARLISTPRISAETLGVQPWMLDRVRKDLTGWSEPQLTLLVRRLAEADAAVKGASRDPEYVVENLLNFISGRGKH